MHNVYFFMRIKRRDYLTVYVWKYMFSGEIVLVKPLEELARITRPGAPIILTIVAEEVRKNWNEPPAQSTVVEIGILLGDPDNKPPYFDNDRFVTWKLLP